MASNHAAAMISSAQWLWRKAEPWFRAQSTPCVMFSIAPAWLEPSPSLDRSEQFAVSVVFEQYGLKFAFSAPRFQEAEVKIQDSCSLLILPRFQFGLSARVHPKRFPFPRSVKLSSLNNIFVRYSTRIYSVLVYRSRIWISRSFIERGDNHDRSS